MTTIFQDFRLLQVELERKFEEISKMQEEIKRVASDAKAKESLVKQLVSPHLKV